MDRHVHGDALILAPRQQWPQVPGDRKTRSAENSVMPWMIGQCDNVEESPRASPRVLIQSRLGNSWLISSWSRKPDRNYVSIY